MKYCKKSKNIDLKCLSVHIGSQILDHKPYEKMLMVIDKVIKKAKYKFKFIWIKKIRIHYHRFE